MNIVLVMIDSLRKDHLGCYEKSWCVTKNIDKFAKESVMYTEAYPECLPTIQVRRSTHTGKRVFPVREFNPRKGDNVRHSGWEPIEEELMTLSEILHDEGYRTAFITDAFHQFKPSMNFHRGFDQWEWIRGQEADKYRSYSLPKSVDLDKYMAPIMKGTGLETLLRQYLTNTFNRKNEMDYFAPQVFSKAMKWLEENQDAERFFLLVDSFDPHEPWDPPQHYVDFYDPGYSGKEIIRPLYGDISYLSESELNHTRALYAAEVTMVDVWFGKFIDKMKELGRLDDTLVIFISDHGIPLGEHGIIGKPAWALYPELMDIPLIIRHPKRIGAGEKCDEFVYNHDLFTTILAMLGIKIPEKQGEGVNIWNYILNKKEIKRNYVTSLFRNYVWCRNRDFTYISCSDGSKPKLFNIKHDPKQMHDISQDNQLKINEMFTYILADAGKPIPNYEATTQTEDNRWFIPKF